MKTLFLLLDAFRHDYINEIDTPFLYSKIPHGTYARKLRSTPGFTQRSAIYTGTAGADSGRFTMFTFDAEGSPFAFLRGDRRISRMPWKKPRWTNLPNRGASRFARKFLRQLYDYRRHRLVSRIRQQAKKYADNAPTGHIPLPMLPEIGLSEDNRPIHLPGAFDQESIFDVFVEQGVGYEYLIYPVVVYQDQAVLDAVLKHAQTPARVVLAQLADSDGKVHVCGPSAPERRAIIGEIDRKLRQMASRYGPETTWILIGDHGMTDVVHEIDLYDLLEPLERRYGVRPGRDYLVFLDSTMARFRWMSSKGEAFGAKVRELPELLEHGVLIDLANAEEHGVPISDRRYGDLIWRANLGVLLFPDYFHDFETRNKGMHGYDSNLDDMKGFFLAFGPNVPRRELEEVDLVDVCPSICRAAGVPVPRHNQGECLI